MIRANQADAGVDQRCLTAPSRHRTGWRCRSPRSRVRLEIHIRGCSTGRTGKPPEAELAALDTASLVRQNRGRSDESTGSIVAALAFARSAAAQCPDGTPPPCEVTTGSTATSGRCWLLRQFVAGHQYHLSRRWADRGHHHPPRAARQAQVASRFAVQRYRARTTYEPAALGHELSGTSREWDCSACGPTICLVTVELLRASSGLQVWADQFDRSDADVLAIEQDIARAVSTAGARLSAPAERAFRRRGSDASCGRLRSFPPWQLLPWPSARSVR